MAANESLESKRINELRPAEMADVQRIAQETLARQSIPGLLAHGVLAAVVLGTISVARAHLVATAVAAVWVGMVCLTRFAIAKSFTRLYASRPVVWTRMFRGGLVLSSTTWGVGGALLLTAGNFDREAWLVLMTLAG